MQREHRDHKLSEVALIGRFFQEDEEMMILTQSDELNRTYSEDNRLNFDRVTNQNNESSDDARRNRPSSRKNILSLTEQCNPAMRERTKDADLMASTSSSRQENPTFKKTRAFIISTEPRTVTMTSTIVPTTDSLWLKNTRPYGKERSSEIQEDTTGSKSEENLNFNEKQNNRRRSYRLVRDLGVGIQKQRLTENGEEKKDEEGIMEEFFTSLEEDRAKMSLASPVQNTAVLNPTSTITAWEASWNVTNAIQVSENFRNISIHSQFDT